MTVSIDITEKGNLKAILDSLDGRIKDLSPIMQRAAGMALGNIDRHFQDERGSKGTWKPLSWRSGKPLQRTGHLRLGNKPSGGKDYAQVENKLEYAGWHNFGVLHGWTIKPTKKKALRFKNPAGDFIFAKEVYISGIPQREFMWVDENTVDKIANMIGDYVIGAKAW